MPIMNLKRRNFRLSLGGFQSPAQDDHQGVETSSNSSLSKTGKFGISGFCAFASTLMAITLFIATLQSRFSIPQEGLYTEKGKPLIMSSSLIQPDLVKPPLLANVLPKTHMDGRKFLVPSNHMDPFVFTAFAHSAKNATTNTPLTLLFLYTQGTALYSGKKYDYANLDVTHCVVGGERHPVIYDANGVYTCAVDRDLKLGEELTVIFSSNIWRKVPINEVFMKEVETQVTKLKQMQDGFYMVPSDVTWEGQIDPPQKDNEGKYRICLMTQEKLFPEYIPEWVAYHRRIGVDHVYLYDNNAGANLSQLYADRDDMEVVHWPWERSQIQAQNHFLVAGRRRCQWVIFSDVDEFVSIRPYANDYTEKPLKRYLRELRDTKDISQVRLTQVALGSSGNVQRPRMPMAEAYWHLAHSQDKLTKPIVYIGHVMPNSLVHFMIMAPSYHTHKTKSFIDEDGDIERIGMVHMKFRSWWDYVRKAQGGRNSFQVNAWKHGQNWTVHEPIRGHLSINNGREYLEFRNMYRRYMTKGTEPPELALWDEWERRTKMVEMDGWAWKPRKRFGNTILQLALVDHDKWFGPIQLWEIAEEKSGKIE